MLTAKDKCAIIRLSLYIASSIGKSGSNDISIERIARFIHRRNISHALVECAHDMNLLDTCNYVLNLSEEKKKVIIWELWEVLIAEGDISKEGLTAYTIIRKEADLNSADIWYRKSRQEKNDSSRATISTDEKRILVTVLKPITHKDKTQRPKESAHIAEFEQKYGISFNDFDVSSADLYDAIDCIRVMPENKRRMIALEIKDMYLSEIKDNVLFKTEIETTEIWKEIFVETDLTDYMK